MPGFNVCGQGSGPSATIEIRRRHRWVMNVLQRGDRQFSEAELLVLLSASRPAFEYAKPEMHHNQEVAYFAGKSKWEPISLKWYDAEQNPDVSGGLYAWLESVSNIVTANVNPPSFYKRNASMSMLNGGGDPTETWFICNAWPSNVNWGEVDYSQTELATIEATMTYDRAQRGCFGVPTPRIFPPSCG